MQRLSDQAQLDSVIPSRAQTLQMLQYVPPWHAFVELKCSYSADYQDCAWLAGHIFQSIPWTRLAPAAQLSKQACAC